MLELLQRLVLLPENRDPVKDTIVWNYVDADAYAIARKDYESDDLFYDAFNDAAETIEPLAQVLSDITP